MGLCSWGLITLFIIAPIYAQDGRCYLKEGSSSASFTVSEALPIGGIIGVLEVGGASGKDGDIVLSLQQGKRSLQNMIHILSETKQLVLTGKLDKEGVDGPSQLHVQVKCERRSGNDPAILIPVRIVVQDANDNAPSFVNAPYVLQLNEAMTPGMVISSDIIRAFDRDQPGPFSTIHYSVEPGPFSEHLAFQSPVGQTLVIKKQLDYETLPHFTVTIKAQDQGQPPLFNKTTLTIRVVDADDQNPRFLNQSYFAVLPKTNSPGDVLKVQPSNIRAEDQDKGINVSVVYSLDSESVDSLYFSVNSMTGEMSINSSIPLDIAFPITLVIRATQEDNEDRRDLATLTIGRSVAFNGIRFLSSAYQLKIPENLPNDSVLLRLLTNRPFDEHLQFTLNNDFDGQFGMSKSGDLLLKRPVDFERNQKINLEVKVTSGTMSDVATVELQMINVNEHDPKFNTGMYRFRASAASIEKNQTIGRIPAVDGDRDDHVTITLLGPSARAFAVDTNGNLFVRNVSLLNSTVSHLVAIATDDGLPPRKSSVPVEVMVPEELIALAGPVDSAFFLMIIFGVSLAVLFIIVIVLSVHIAKRNRQRERVSETPLVFPIHQPMAKMSSYASSLFSHQKLSSGVVADGATIATTAAASDTDRPLFSTPAASVTTFVPQPTTTARHHFHLHPKRKVCPMDNPAVFHDSPTDDTVRRLMNGYPLHQPNNNNDSSTDDGHNSQGFGSDDEDSIEDDNDVNVDETVSDSDAIRCKRIFVKSKHNMDATSAKRSSMKVTNKEKAVPKRVKKLSWEDEQTQKQTAELDVDANGMPLLIKRLSHPDTTVDVGTDLVLDIN